MVKGQLHIYAITWTYNAHMEDNIAIRKDGVNDGDVPLLLLVAITVSHWAAVTAILLHSGVPVQQNLHTALLPEPTY